MSFSSFSFLLFLVPMFPIYALIPKPAKNVMLLLASLIFYAWGDITGLPVLLGMILFTWLFGLLLAGGGQRRKKLLLAATLTAQLGLLVFYKYADFFFGSFWELPARALPLGLSFYTFHAMSYVIDVYRQKAPAQKSPLAAGLYLALFPKLIMGPIVPYHQLEQALDDHPMSLAQTSRGCLRFAVGLAKKAVLADAIAVLVSAVWRDTWHLTTASAWLGLLAYALQLYFDFSGYSDMAVGLGLMLGFRLPENFHYPYLCGSISDFWRRWHMTLSAWFKEYLYFPLGGSRRGTLCTVRNLLIVWLATGLWHGASWNYVLWGLYFGVLIVLEKLLHPETLGGKVGAACYRIVCLLLVLLGWVLFRSGDLATAGRYYRALFGGTALLDSQARLYFHDNWLHLLVGCIAATPLAAHGTRWLADRLPETAAAIGQTLLMLALLALSLLWLVNNSFQGFVYFQF